MPKKLHGVVSLILISASVAIALIYILNASLGWGLVYFGIIILAIAIVLFSYCAKCTCSDDACSHVLPGKLAGFMPKRQQGPYSSLDYFWTTLSLIALCGFPVFWLWQSKALLATYLILLLIGLIEILFLVCKACDNINCPVKNSLPNE
jgi:hypothetical protein